MNSESYFLTHMGLATGFPWPHPLLTIVVENFVFPLSLHVDTSSIQHSLFEYYVCCASVIPRPLPWLATKAAIASFPLSLSI